MYNAYLRIMIIFIVFSPSLAKAAAISYDCDFTTIATPEGLSKESFKLKFLFDSMTEKSVIMGNNGVADVAFVNNAGGGLSFVEITATGNIMTTTITDNGDAVHSRNGIMFGNELIPSQYYGKCIKTSAENSTLE